ncbi:nucleobase-ascorbate transporter 4-like isoform X1 [Chenopodium quinoa]|uniref:nucleobase-ascorbate transporter 4-like isoform X1 n=2 Tax=Chenopodium quinoa TaxID=63459 RepID=UPI000B77C5C9|nr:nucleobase-ascorbate transporter 4-like isoform X1 [Chenopodium quinoa]
MAAPKAENLGPFPVREQLSSVDFCLTSNPPWHEAIILGFQHFLVMLGTTIMITTILVPQMGGGPVEKARVIQTLLLVSGLNTLMQTFVGCRTAVVIGGSYVYVIPAIFIIFSDRFGRIIDPHERFVQSMRALQGALMFASILPVVIGVLGFWRIVIRILSPLAAIPLVTLTGLGLFQFGFPQLAKCIGVGLPALIVMVFISQYMASLLKPLQALCRRYAVIATIALIWAFAAVLTAAGAFNRNSPNTQFYCRTDRSGLISAASWIRVPYPFQWGRPTLNVANGFAVMAAAFVSMVESTGTFIAVARYGSATPMPPSIVSRGIAWLGAGHFLNGMFGAICGPTASVANAGLLGLNQIGSRRVAQIAAIFMILFSIFGKFGALLASIPLPIFAALYCILFAYVVSAGLGFLQFCNLNSFRTKFILGFSLFMGLSVPQYFNEVLLVSGHTPVNTKSMAFNSIVQVIFTSPATVGGLLALLLDITLHRSHADTRKDSGRHFWKKFRSYEADTRSEEFYSLPWGLNKYFPSV